MITNLQMHNTRDYFWGNVIQRQIVRIAGRDWHVGICARCGRRLIAGRTQDGHSIEIDQDGNQTIHNCPPA